MNLPGFLPMLLIFSSLFLILNNVFIQIIQAQRQSLESAIISVLSGLLSLGLSIMFVLLLKEDRYLGKILAVLVIGFIFSMYYLRRILAKIKFTFKKDHLKYILIYSIPLIPYVLSSTIIAYFDRIIISNTIDASAAGLYSLGYNIAMLLAIIISATQTALMPDFFDFLNKKQYSRLDALVGKVFSLISFAALGLIFFSREIVIILADVKFHEALVVVPIIVVGYIFYGMFTVYGRYIGYAKKTIYSSLVMIISGISNVILNAILIPQYGYIAAAYTTVFSYFLLFFLSWFVSKFILKQTTTPLWKIWKPVTLLFCYLVVYFVLTQNIIDLILLFVVKFILLALFGFSVFYREIKILMFS
jgi:O-antigen/teichoic acid export membrane protein